MKMQKVKRILSLTLACAMFASNHGISYAEENQGIPVNEDSVAEEPSDDSGILLEELSDDSEILLEELAGEEEDIAELSDESEDDTEPQEEQPIEDAQLEDFIGDQNDEAAQPQESDENLDREMQPEDPELVFEKIWIPGDLTEILKDEDGKWRFSQDLLFEDREDQEDCSYKSLLTEGLEMELYELLEDYLLSAREDEKDHTVQLEFSLGEFDTEDQNLDDGEVDILEEGWEDAFQNAMDAFWYDHVDANWLDREECKIRIVCTGEEADEGVHWSADAVWELVCKYEEEDADSMTEELDRFLEQYGRGEQEKEVYVKEVYEYLADQTAHMLEIQLEDEGSEEDISEEPADHASEAYGVLIWEEGNSYDQEGAARAFKQLCENAGIPCVIVRVLTEEEEIYTWNYVCPDEENWYTADIWQSEEEREALYLFPGLMDAEPVEEEPLVTPEESEGDEGTQTMPTEVEDGVGEETEPVETEDVPITSDIEYKSVEFSGSAREPKIAVKKGDQTLTEGTDYSLQYWNNTDAGTASVSITGKGEYSSYSETKTFQITRKALSKSDLSLAYSKVVYDGTNKKPDVTLKYNGIKFKKNTDYKVTYADYKNAGTGTVTVQGINNFSGTVKLTYTISKVSISSASVSLTDLWEYTGKSVKVTPGKVKVGSKALVKGKDYTVSYKNSSGNKISAGSVKKAGDYRLVIKGIGNYKGSVTKKFRITKNKLIRKVSVKAISSQSYTGGVIKPKIVVTYGTGKTKVTLKQNKHYKVTYSNNKLPGTATIKIQGVTKGGYEGTKSVTFKIVRKSLSSKDIKVTFTAGKSKFKYTGKAQKPSVKVMYGKKKLVKGVDYKVTYLNNKDVGTAKVRLTGIGNYKGTKDQKFVIESFSESDKVTIKSCTAAGYDAEAGKLTIKLKVSSNSALKKLEGSLYIVQMDSLGKKVLKRISGKKSGSSTITVSGQFSATDGFRSAMMSKYALAVKTGKKYQQISKNVLYIGNPEVTASMTEPYNGYYEKDGKVTSKKGLQGASEDYMEDLGVQHVLLNVDMATLVSTKAKAGYVKYSYKGNTYYFQDLNALVQTARYLNGWDNDNPFGWHRRNITLNLLLSWKNDLSYLIHPSARSKGAAPYYAPNMKEKKARETFEALFCYMGERLGENRKSRICNWVLGNEVNCCQAWNYSGGLSLQDCVANYADAFQLLYQGVKRTDSNTRVFISLDHGWGASDSGHSGKAYLDEFASYMNKTAPAIQWNVDYHPYSQPLSRVDFWKDGGNTTNSSNTSYISMKNIKVLTNYLGTLETKYGKPKGSIRVILGEQGFSAVHGNSGAEKKQAAALGYGYYIAAFNNRVDAYIIRSYLDDPVETRAGLYLGLMSADHRKKQSYDVYKYVDTNQSESYMKKYLPTVGLSSWKSGVPGFNAAKLAVGDF